MDRMVLKTVSTVEAVSDMLEKDIYTLHYMMGEKIKEVDLVERYNVSRNTLREAMAYLVSKGLLEKVANKGIYVKEILADDIEEIFKLRELLEGEAIRRIVACGTVSDRLCELADEVSRFNPDSEPFANRNADIAFHRFLVESAGSARLINLYDNILSEVKLCIFQACAFVPGRPENTVLHYKLVNAMKEQNVDKALGYLATHIESAIETYKIGIVNHQKALKAREISAPR